MIVLETVPADFMDLPRQINDYPELKRLSAHSIIATQHYTTFPASAESFASIILGVYPPRNYYQSCLVNKQELKNLPGLLSEARTNNYRSALYLPYMAGVPLDKRLQEFAGFDKVYATSSNPDYKKNAETHFLEPGVFLADDLAFSELLSDIEENIEKKNSYLSIFLPQSGHAPFPNRPPSMSIADYGHQLTVNQLKWLSKLTKLLKAKNTLDKTTIIITGDHGIRTGKEDPKFIPGLIDEYSFKVPLFIFAENLIPEPQTITGPTSHIDLLPTLIDMHGWQSDLEFQGLPIRKAAQSNRRLFFFADWYFSADGFMDDGKFYMTSHILERTLENDSMKFDLELSKMSPNDSLRVVETISDMKQLSFDWIEKVICTYGNS